MNLIHELARQHWASALGWALLHSLWQGMIIILLVKFLIGTCSSGSSKVRYIIACSGMAVMLLTGILSFVILFSSPEAIVAPGEIVHVNSYASPSTTQSNQNIVHRVTGVIDPHTDIIVLAWFAGAFLFLLRLAGAGWYLRQLTANATFIQGEWKIKLATLASRLNIANVISLAESTRIHTPVVVGYLKPVILIPAGMLTGLSAGQIESIFLHELAHIRRHDFLINIIQSCIEVLFFFNPFTWLLSDIVRQEREYCCDDAVLTHHGDPVAYANALALLEQSRISGLTLGLSLAASKNQLLTRIKRIMEKSITPSGSGERILPVILVITGLACASWLTIQTDPNSFSQKQSVHSDTTIRQKEKTAGYYRKSIVTTDENGEPVQQIVEEYDGEQAIAAKPPFLAFPDVPDPLVEIPALPPMHPIIDLLEPFDEDTIPGRMMFKHRDLERFSEEFEQELRERFSDFYQKNGEDIAEMMESIQEKIESEFDQGWWPDARAAEAMAREEIARLREDFQGIESELGIAAEALREAEIARRFAEKDVAHPREAHANHLEQQRRELEVQRKRTEEDMLKLESKMKRMEENIHSFETTLKEELIEDGYISKDEQIRNISWDDKGDIVVNGRKIRENDRKKYNDLHRKYLKERSFNHPE